MEQAKYGDTVKVHYTGTLADGTVFDTSMHREPLQFSLGAGQVITGFERAILGMTPGESKTITIPAEHAYGPHQEDRVHVLPRNQFPTNLEPQIGQQLEARSPNGQILVVTVIDFSEADVTLDTNHPLAGKDLTFNIQLIAIV
jgi:peptidylprolyl isomerase